MSEHVRTDLQGHLGLVTIDRPEKAHAMTLDMTAAIRTEVAAMDADPRVWAILLRSTGDRAFSAGGDLGDLVPRALEAGGDVINADPRVRFFSRVYTPMVCSVQGPALGAGLELVLGTDIRIASERATFGLPEVGFGLIAGSGSSIMLPRQVPWVHAMDLMLGGAAIGAAKALAIGLVNDVVPHDEVQDAALEYAQKLTANAPLAMRAAKEIAARSLAFEPHFALEHEINSRVLMSEDAASGLQAMRAKVTPIFSHA